MNMPELIPLSEACRIIGGDKRRLRALRQECPEVARMLPGRKRLLYVRRVLEHLAGVTSPLPTPSPACTHADGGSRHGGMAAA